MALALLVCFCSMAPRKRKAEGVEEAAVKPVAETKLTRVTRSVTRRVNSNLAESAAMAELPTKRKKAKATGNKKKEDVKAEEEIEAEKVKVEEDIVEPETEEAEGDAFDGDESKERTVVIEHW